MNYDTATLDEIWEYELKKYHTLHAYEPRQSLSRCTNGIFYDEPNNIILYIKNEKLHRTDGPAMISKTAIHWYYNGTKSRLDGPAIIHKNGNKEYIINGKKLKKSQFTKITQN